VAKGYSQIAGLDYEKTFAPVVRTESIRSLFTSWLFQESYYDALRLQECIPTQPQRSRVISSTTKKALSTSDFLKLSYVSIAPCMASSKYPAYGIYCCVILLAALALLRSFDPKAIGFGFEFREFDRTTLGDSLLHLRLRFEGDLFIRG
jgi:hypothetical protein